jgi:AraC-like DNA-binding protein
LANPDIVRTTHLRAVVHSLSDLGLDCSALLKKHHLPVEFSDDPFSVVPLMNSVQFIEDVTLETGFADLGLSLAGMHGYSEIGLFGAYIQKSYSVFDAIGKLISKSGVHNSGMRYLLIGGEKNCVLQSASFSKLKTRNNATEQYTLGHMIDIVRMGSGLESWEPKNIWLRADKEAAKLIKAKFPNSKIYVDQAATGINIKNSEFARSLRKQNKSAIWDFNSKDSLSPTAMVENLPLIIKSYLGGGYLSINEVSEILEVSKRTIQRKLFAQGLSYSEIIDQVRMEMATDIWSHAPNTSVTQLTSELGFGHPNALTRAFRRWTGVSPTEYRNILAVQNDNGSAGINGSNFSFDHQN